MLCIPRQVRIRLHRSGLRSTPEEVSEISQDIFAAIWERLDRFRGDSSLEGWAHGFVARVTLASMRKHARARRVLSDTALDDLPEAATTDAEEVSAQVAELLAQLKPEEERVVQLRYLEGLSYAGLAERLDCSERAARARFQRAMDRLRDLAKRKGLSLS